MNPLGNPKEILPFRVFWHKDNKGQCSLKLVKPNRPTWDNALVLNEDYPNVCTQMVNAEDQHALAIMHNLNHKNIMCMRALGRSKSQKGNEISAVIQESNGKIHNSLAWHVFGMNGLIPSLTFQDITMEIIDGADFLWRNRTYHGNLNWGTTHFEHPYTVKLFGFKKKVVPLEEAQWQDWDDIVAMLEGVVAEALINNADPSVPPVVYDELQGLIDTIKASTRVNIDLLDMRASIFEDVFFWKTRERAKFCMITVAKLFYNVKFINEVEDSSICPTPWYNRTRLEDKTKSEGLTNFELIVKYCNDYRESLDIPVPFFSENSRMSFVRLLYAAYTHRSEIMAKLHINVDYTIRPIFPRIFLELNPIVKRNLSEED